MLHVVRCMLHATRTRCECSASALLGGSADRRGTRVYYVSTTRFPLPIRTDPLRYCTKGGSIAPSPQRCSGKTDHTYLPNRCRRRHTHVSAQRHYHERHPARSLARVVLYVSRVVSASGRPKSWHSRCKRTSARWRCQASRSERLLAAAPLHCTALHCTMSAGLSTAVRCGCC